MLKLCVGINRKEGRPDFGSAGASLSMEFEIAATPGDGPAIAEQVKAAYDLLNALVDDELARQTDKGGQNPPLPTAAQNGDYKGSKASGRWGSATADAAATNGSGRISRPSHPPTVKTDRGTTVVLDDAPPKTGREMWAWASGQEERHGVQGLKRFLKSFGEVNGYPEKTVNWSREQTTSAYQAALDKFNPPTY